MTNVTLTISGMNCGHCVKAVTEALSALPGLSELSELHVEVGRATFRSATVPDPVALAAAIDEAGFELASLASVDGGA